MAKQPGEARDVNSLLKQNADAERRLLKRERAAERDVAELREKLAQAEDQLDKARQRVGRRSKALAAAEEELDRQRAARASGPNLPPGTATDAPEPSAQQPAPAAS